MPGKQIKPYVEEISLAFDPANKKKFILMKEGIMPNLVEVLTSKDEMFKGKEVGAFLDALVKDQKLTQDGSDAIQGALRVLYAFKDGIPRGILSNLAKSIPDYADFAIPVDEDADAREARLAKELEDAKNDFLENEKSKLEADLRKQIEKEMKKDGDPKALQARVDQLEKDIKDSKKEIADSKKEAEKAKDDARLVALKAMVKEINVIGDVDKHANTIFSLEKISADLAKDYIDQLKDVKTRLDAAGMFSELGLEGPGESGSAYEKLVKVVEGLTKEGKLSQSEAWRKAAKDNPELYKEYRTGTRR